MSQMSADGMVPQWDLGDRLGKALRHGGVTVYEMAEYLGVSRNSVGNYLAGRTKPSRGALVAWALRTGVPLSWLETGMAPRPEPGGHPEKYTARDSNPEPIGSQLALVTAHSLALAS